MDNDLASMYGQMGDEELLLIVSDHAEQYTEYAQKIARNELERRNEIYNKQINSEKSSVKDASDAKSTEYSNRVSDILKFIGTFLLVFGALIGIIVSVNTELINGVTIIGSSFISGMIFIGFGEVIRLLHSINEKMKT